LVIKAIRPLLDRAPSRYRHMIDSEATARRRAEARILEPVLAPLRERWLNVALVLDGSSSMDVWRPTLRDFRGLLEKAGAFRSVRVWQLIMDQKDPSLRLAVKATQPGQDSESRRPLEILGPEGRSLVLIVSDCVSPAWSSPVLVEWLGEWSRLAAVVVVQVLSPRLWSRTILGDGEAGCLRPLGSGLERRSMWRPDWLGAETGKSVPVPVIPLTPENLADMARFLMGRGGSEVRGYRLSFGLPVEDTATPWEATGESIVRYFRSSASRTAHRLATLLAAAPVITLPVIRLLSGATDLFPTNCLPEHLAEVWLGGLLQADPATARADDPDEVFYDFREGVRDCLFDGLARPDAVQVLEQVSEYVENNLGRLRGLRGYLANPKAAQGVFDPNDKPFALIAAVVLRRLGGDYATLADKLEKQLEGKPVRFGVWLRGLRDLAQEWIKEGGIPNATAQTPAYVDLVFSFGLGRLGENDAARDLLARAKSALNGKDDAHNFLYNAFEHRIKQALDGKPHTGPLPNDQLEYLEHMERLLRYVGDRLRMHSRILEPDQGINAYRHFGDRSDFERALAELTDLTDRNELANRVDKLLREVPKGAKGNKQSVEVLRAGLEAAPRVGEDFARKMLDQTVTAYDALPEAKEMADLMEPAAFLEKALFVAGHYGRMESVHPLVTRFQNMLKGQKGPQALQVLIWLGTDWLRGLRKLGMRDEIDTILRQMAELVLEGQEVKAIDFKKREQGPAALRALLQVAAGWYFFGRDSQAEPILQAARGVLLAGDLPPRDQTRLAVSYASAVGQAPVEVAQKRLEEVFRQLKGIKDTYTTSSHFSVSQLDVVESVVLAALECSASRSGSTG
jgi:hypothetical protein